MNRLPFALGLLALTLTTACSQQNPDTAGADTVAVVDGVAISRNTFNYYAQGMAGRPLEELTAEEREELLDNLVRGQLVAADAERLGLAGQDEHRAELELQRLNVLQQAAALEYLKDRRPSEEELRAEYDLQVAQLDRLQYRVSHIVVPDEEAATALIAQLQRGANFAQLARQHSIDTSSSQNGGDLDWSSPSAMPSAFARAVTALGKGQTSAAPLRSERGWHVVRVTDTRENTPPPYETVRDRLVQMVEAKKFQVYVDNLQGKAKITKSL